jgi:hypothetical protein
MLSNVVWYKFPDVSEVPAASIWAITLMMEAASTSDTSVNFYHTTERNIPEDSHPHAVSPLRQTETKPNTTRGSAEEA